jgi:sporulation protein YlmC with PRC-barrel domain
MEIPLQAQVECADGVCGRSEFLLMNPVLEQVTHLVVKEISSPNREFIVPLELVSGVLADMIHLHCSKADLQKLEPFIQTRFIQEEVPDRPEEPGGPLGTGGPYFFPYVTSERTVYESVQSEQIPPGELAVRRGTRVNAVDGYVGRVDEFIVNPENGRITHLVMREGHLWGQRDVVIPLSAIRKTGEETVLLNLEKRQIEKLPTYPVHRLWS